MKICIIIPAYNEENRIERTLEAYSKFFNKQVSKSFDYEILIVINNTSDNTESIVKNFQQHDKKIRFLNFKPGGKGFAIKEGFKDALTRKNELIGFVDADMATLPEDFFSLVKNLGASDGIIANRYDSKSIIIPRFTFRRLIVGKAFNILVRSLFSFNYKDTQCGAKLFTRETVKNIMPYLTITQWAFDIDFLHIAKRNNLNIKAAPTKWRDVEGSKIRLLGASIGMFLAVIQLRILHSPFKRLLPLAKNIIGALYSTTQRIV